MPGCEPVVLFQKGAVRILDSLLAAPQQPIEEVLAPEEAIWSVSHRLTDNETKCRSNLTSCAVVCSSVLIYLLLFVFRWSTNLVAESQQFVIFTTEQVT